MTTKSASEPVKRRQLLAALGIGLVAGGGGGFAGGYFVAKGRARRPRAPQRPAHIKIEAHNVRIGTEPAKVTLVEFFDYQ